MKKGLFILFYFILESVSKKECTLPTLDLIQDDFAFISKYYFCDLHNWEYDANTKHCFTFIFIFTFIFKG